mgnify:CR=1 FL=1
MGSNLKQFDLYKRESILKGNTPQQLNKKIWVDLKTGICQSSDRTTDLSQVNWIKFNKFKWRNRFRILTPITLSNSTHYYIKLNLIDIIYEFVIENMTEIMAWIGGILSIILTIIQL